MDLNITPEEHNAYLDYIGYEPRLSVPTEAAWVITRRERQAKAAVR